MNIKFYLNNDILYLNLGNYKQIIDLSVLNLILIKKSNEFSILKNIKNIKNIENEISNNDYLLIVGYEYEGDYKILEYLKTKFNLNYINYVKINLYYICGIYLQDNIVDLENIYLDVNNINIDINYNLLENNNLNNDLNLINIKNKLNNISETLSNFENKIKEFSLEEVDIKRTNLFLKFDILEEFINNLENKYKLIEKQIDKKNLFIENFNNNNLEKESFEFEDKENYLKQLLNIINNFETVKSNKINKLDNLDKEIFIKEKEIKLLNDNINKINNNIQNLNQKRNELINQYNYNKNNSLIINNVNLCVCVHIFKVEIYYDIERYLINLKNADYNYDLYINIATNTEIELEKIEYKELLNALYKLKKENTINNLFITYSDNRGMDIGGFMKSYIKILENGINYKYLIKIHTKTNDNWRFALLYSLLGNKKLIDNNFNLLKNNNIGMVGNQTIPLNWSINKNSYNYIDIYMKQFNIPICVEGNFVPGTIFIIKNEIFKKYFTKKDLEKCYNDFKQDYCGFKENKTEGKPHAFERFFGILVNHYGKETVKFDINM